MQSKNLNFFQSSILLAVEASRQQLQAFRSNQGTRPVLEEFMPIKHPNSQESTEKTSKITQETQCLTWKIPQSKGKNHRLSRPMK